MPKIRAASIDEHKELTRQSLLEAAWRVIDDAGTLDLAEILPRVRKNSTEHRST